MQFCNHSVGYIDRAFISGTLFVTCRGIPALIRREKSVTLISYVATIVPVGNARTIDTPTNIREPVNNSTSNCSVNYW